MYPSATCSYHSILWFWDLSVRILLVSFLCCAEVHCVNTLQFSYLLSCQQVLTAFSRFSLFTTIWQWILCFLFLRIRVSLSTYLGVELLLSGYSQLTLHNGCISLYYQQSSFPLHPCQICFPQIKKYFFCFCQFERVMLYLTLVLFCTSSIASKAEHHIWARHTYTNT